ncbi:MAG TPA: sodium-translocating pyrophosphatase [Ktedonobacterales bacterium]|nr:sodium-translocating pyrophosphatase [Ktedonobacterales bacterium]
MNNIMWWLAVPVVASVAAIVFAVYLSRWVFANDTGTPEMRKVSDAIFTGAQAFLGRQYRTIATLAVVAAVVIGIALLLLGTISGTEVANLTPTEFALRSAIAFLFGAACSGVAGFIGMNVAVRSNIRVASAARRGLGDALLVAFRGGAVTGFLVIALSLLGVTIVYIVFGGLGGNQSAITTPATIVGFGFGASFVALFAQLGGGIYTKAADVGADLVGKVEAGIPEDDPRNPAVIADLVGDNVGDCAGRGADIFESTAAENIGAMILGASVAGALGVAGSNATGNPAWVIFPLVVVGIGIICSIIGVLAVRKSHAMEPGRAGNRDPGEIALGKMNQGYYLTSALAAIGIFLAAYLLLGSNSYWWAFGLCGLVGILTSFAFVLITQYYTSGTFRPVREIADAAKTGPATTIISGLAVGFENTAPFVLIISVAIGLAYYLGTLTGLPSFGVISLGGIYGTAVATMGMLMSAGYILAMDSFGPITDNAGGIVEMSGSPDSVRNITDALDGVGNTTKALTKGYGIGSAALAAFLLFSAYLDILRENHVADAYTVNLANPPIFIAALIGAMLIFLFSSLAIRAVGKAAQGMIQEVRRQFRADPGIMKGESEPDYAKCVDISTGAALREMVVPGILVVGTPILVGVILGPSAAAGLLMVGTIGGIMMALVMNNGGGAWDNAKKFIEAGYLKDENGKVLGKRTPAHDAAVVGDTVGDPFKDTAGPSLHIVIKLLSTITLVLAPLFIVLHR